MFKFLFFNLALICFDFYLSIFFALFFFLFSTMMFKLQCSTKARISVSTVYLCYEYVCAFIWFGRFGNPFFIWILFFFVILNLEFIAHQTFGIITLQFKIDSNCFNFHVFTAEISVHKKQKIKTNKIEIINLIKINCGSNTTTERNRRLFCIK